MQAISEQTRIVRLPLNRLSSINKIRKAIPVLEQEYERRPTNDEIATHLDLSFDEVETANNINKRQVSFDKPLSNEGDNDFSLYDVVQTGDIPSPDSNLMEESLITDVKRALSKLSQREAEILVRSFGLNNSSIHSLNDMATEFGLSAERVRQIRRTGLCKLKSLLKEKFTWSEQ